MWYNGLYEGREFINQKEVRQILCILSLYQTFIPAIFKLAFWSFGGHHGYISFIVCMYNRDSFRVSYPCFFSVNEWMPDCPDIMLR